MQIKNDSETKKEEEEKEISDIKKISTTCKTWWHKMLLCVQKTMGVLTWMNTGCGRHHGEDTGNRLKIEYKFLDKKNFVSNTGIQQGRSRSWGGFPHCSPQTSRSSLGKRVILQGHTLFRLDVTMWLALAKQWAEMVGATFRQKL